MATSKADQDYTEASIDSVVKRLNASPKVTPANRMLVGKTITFLEAKGSDRKTIAKWVYAIERIYNALGKKNMLDASREDIERAVARLNTSDYAPWTISTTLTTLKCIFKHFKGEDIMYPREVAWIKIRRPKPTLTSKDLLGEQDILKMLKIMKNPRDRAILALMYDAGLRVGEILRLKKGDIHLENKPATITIPVEAKTGGTTDLPIDFSNTYLAAYLETIKDKSDNDALWGVMRVNEGKDALTYNNIRKIIKQAAFDAGIRKRVWPHLLRHSRITQYRRQGLSDAGAKAYFRWAKDTRMLAVYDHYDTKDLGREIARLNGKEIAETKQDSPLKNRSCPRCSLENSADSLFCSRCGSALDMVAVLNAEKAKELALQSALNPQLLQKVISKMVKNAMRTQHMK